MPPAIQIPSPLLGPHVASRSHIAAVTTGSRLGPALGDHPRFRRSAIAALNLLATIQVVWFYVNRVPTYLHLLDYEQGRERIPFQNRMLMMYPMRWAHGSPWIVALAHQLNSMPGWFPNGVRAEGVVQAAIDLVCVIITGLVAHRLYRRASRYGLLAPFVYPLTLVMIASTYCLLNMHLLRFLYDLPSLAFFAIGLEFIYFRRSPYLFALLFVIATMNRETTLFLLFFFALAEGARQEKFELRRLYAAANLGVILPLALFWLAWHAYITRRFAHNPTASIPHFYLNVGLLLLPITWPQLFGAGGYLWPCVLLFRRQVHDTVLRAWMWVPPLWFAFMLYYGILIETRIFGELIPYFACAAMLICEERLLPRAMEGAYATPRPGL